MDKDIIQIEYNNIKQEIFTLMQRCDNLIVAMYTVCITLLGLGYELNNRFFFMLILIFIVPIQGLINAKRYHMARCSVYIRCWLEPQCEEFRWEKTVGEIDVKFNEQYLKQNHFLKNTSCVVGLGTIIIAFVATILYITNTVSLFAENAQYSWIDIGGIIVSLIIFVMICYLAKEYINYKNICQIYEEILKEIMNTES